MKKVKRWRYYCDFCKKVGSQGPPMERHEKNCTMNPDRGCGMCDRLDNSFPEPIEVLMAPLKELEVLRAELPRFSELREETKVAIEKLREKAGGCPACMLAAIRQSQTPFIQGLFVYKEEVESFWKEVNENQANIEFDSYLIRSVGELRRCIKRGRWIYLHDRPKHPSVIAHMTFKTVTGFIDHGCLWSAKLNKKETPWMRI